MKKLNKNLQIVNRRNTCRVCKSKNLNKIFDLGVMPLAGNFIKKENLNKKEIKVPLILYFCKKCKLVQVKDSINPEVLFNSYNYSSSTIPTLKKHFVSYAKKIKKKYFSKNIQLLEFGCNDGVLLNEFKKNKNIFCLGVDPSKNISKLAKKKGLNIVNSYFNKETANIILKKYNKFDYITGSNVFAHIDDIHSVVEASKILLKQNGRLVVEVHYLLDLIELNQYDFFYHEHLNYYTINSLNYLFNSYDLNISNIEKIDVHGGSLRITAIHKKKNKKTISKPLLSKIKSEKDVNIQYFKKFSKNISLQKRDIVNLLKNLVYKKKKIFGFGASGRGSTFLNYCKLDKKFINCVIDGSPLRAGKYMPGVKIPIYDINYLIKNSKNLDYILIIAWNYQKSIMKQVRKINKKVKFIIPFPKPKILF